MCRCDLSNAYLKMPREHHYQELIGYFLIFVLLHMLGNDKLKILYDKRFVLQGNGLDHS